VRVVCRLDPAQDNALPLDHEPHSTGIDPPADVGQRRTLVCFSEYRFIKLQRALRRGLLFSCVFLFIFVATGSARSAPTRTNQIVRGADAYLEGEVPPSSWYVATFQIRRFDGLTPKIVNGKPRRSGYAFGALFICDRTLDYPEGCESDSFYGAAPSNGFTLDLTTGNAHVNLCLVPVWVQVGVNRGSRPSGAPCRVFDLMFKDSQSGPPAGLCGSDIPFYCAYAGPDPSGSGATVVSLKGGPIAQWYGGVGGTYAGFAIAGEGRKEGYTFFGLSSSDAIRIPNL
jgi:hypothetical protein